MLRLECCNLVEMFGCSMARVPTLGLPPTTGPPIIFPGVTRPLDQVYYWQNVCFNVQLWTIPSSISRVNCTSYLNVFITSCINMAPIPSSNSNRNIWLLSFVFPWDGVMVNLYKFKGVIREKSLGTTVQCEGHALCDLEEMVRYPGDAGYLNYPLLIFVVQRTDTHLVYYIKPTMHICPSVCYAFRHFCTN